MKKLIVFCALTLASTAAHATEIRSSDKIAQTNIARVVQLIPLVAKDDGLRVAIAVRDLGGSTDVSPTQEAFLTIYLKGEMFSTDAAFDLGPVFEVKSAKRISGGHYEVAASMMDENGMPTPKTLEIDATKAVAAMRAVRCEDFDCPASENFKSTIEVK